MSFDDLKEISISDKKFISKAEVKTNLKVIDEGENKKIELEIVAKNVNAIRDRQSKDSDFIKKYHFQFEDMLIDSDKMNITINNKIIDLLDSDFNIRGANSRNYTVYSDLIEANGVAYLLPIFMLDNLSSFNVVEKSSVNLLNQSTKQAPLGNCYALVYLQKKLMENVFFDPAEEKRVASYYEKIMKQALTGEKVVAPGVKSIRELSDIITEEKVQSIVSDLNQRVGHFSNAFFLWFQRESIDSNNIDKIKQYVRNGIYPVITFVPYAEVRAEHALLLYDIEEKEDFYLLHVYDPNFGIIPKISPIQFKLDKKTFSLSASAYKHAVPDSIWINFNQLK